MWTRKISMSSFDYQCVEHSGSRDDHWNYVGVNYVTSQGQDIFSVRVSPQDALFNKLKAQPLSVKNQISASQSSLYYESEYNSVKSSQFLLTDKNGMDVVIASTLPMDQAIQLIGELVATKRTGTANPWVENCR